MDNESFVVGFAVGVLTSFLLFVGLGLGFAMVRPWLRLKMSGGRGTLLQIVGMRLRGTPPMMIVEAYTSLLHSGQDVRLIEVESTYVANKTTVMNAHDLIELVQNQNSEG